MIGRKQKDIKLIVNVTQSQVKSLKRKGRGWEMEKIQEIINKLIQKLTNLNSSVEEQENKMDEAKENLKLNVEKVKARSFCYKEIISIVLIAIAFTYLAFVIFA